ncbi:hypothetical protein BASA81_002560 [Batrachochytrium salamandrivorans]|nr:hypothetical protein BASA81_002560 [Batrachochytrium salamandrivorans]
MSEPISFEKNSFVFIPDEREVYVPAKVVEPFICGKSEGKVSRLDQGLGMVNLGIEPISIQTSEHVLPMDENSTRAQTNLVNLKTINDAAILHNIRMRFRGDQVFTYVGDILISVNPYKFLPLFTPDVIERYKTLGSRDEPPHVYAVADKAWRSIANAGTDLSVRDQAIIVQGESGSGKTEVTKLLLQYVAEMSGGIRTMKEIARGAEAPIQEQILRTNPLLEAFGNSKTQKNDNSSRFGKFIESRVVEQAQGERNYHIFYQLLAGANKDAKLKALHRLGEPDEYYFLNQNLWDAGPGAKQVQDEFAARTRRKKTRINDEGDWEDMCASMEVLDMTLRERDAVFQCVAAILHLGNIHFESESGTGVVGTKVTNPDQLQFVAKELGCSSEALTMAFCNKTIRVDKKVIMGPRTVEAAETARNSLAKDLYARLFKWLVDRVNFTLMAGGGGHAKKDILMAATDLAVTTKPEKRGFLGLFGRMRAEKATTTTAPSKSHKEITIGVLDIFGFEQIETNSFEQLCINYCNEKLQAFFTQQVFDLEQQEYANENIKVPPVDFSTDSEQVLKLLESKPAGVFCLLEDEVKVNSNSDDGFVLKLFQYNNHLIPHILNRASVKEENAHVCFTIQHYADKVTYDSTGLVHKNKAAIPKELLKTAKSSSLVFMRELFGDVPFGSAAQAIEALVSPRPDSGATGGEEEMSHSSPAAEEEPSMLFGPDGPGLRRSFNAKISNTGQSMRKGVEATIAAATPRPISVNRRASFLPTMLTAGLGRAAEAAGNKTTNHQQQVLRSHNEKEDEENDSGGASTIMVQFKSQLDELVALLGVCEPHFIRCIKPNSEMRGGKFNSVLVMEQIKVASILPIANIRQWGFPSRLSFSDFLVRYRALDPHRGKRDQAKTGKLLSESLRLNPAQYRLGKTKVFMKNSLALELEMKRDLTLTGQTVQLQRVVRGHLARAKFRSHHATLDDLVSAMLTRSFDMLNQALQNTAELPNHGRHLDAVKDARMLHTRLSEENRIVQILKLALENRDLTSLLAGVAAAKEIKLQSHLLLQEVQPMIDKLTAQREVHQILVDAVQSNDAKTIALAMATATKVDAGQDEAFRQCVAIKSRAGELAQVLQDLDRASKERSLPQLSALLTRSVILGIPSTTSDAGFVKFRQIRQAIRHEDATCRLVDFAVERRDEQDLKTALQKADAIKSIKPERLQAARELKQLMEKEGHAVKLLAQANLKNDPILIEQALKSAEAVGLEMSIMHEAARNKDRIRHKEAAVGHLNKALEQVADVKQKSDTKIATLTVAMLEAASVGASTGRAYNEAGMALKQLGRRAEIGIALCEAVSSEDPESLETNMRLWRKEGLPEDALQIPRQMLGELRQEAELAKQLVEAMNLGDVAALTRLMSEIQDDFPNFAKRNHYTYEKTKSVLGALKASALAIKYRDLALLETCLQLAARAGVQHVGPVARMEDLRTKLVKERDFVHKLQLDNAPQLRELFKRAPFDLKDDAYDEVLDAKAEVDRANRVDKVVRQIDEANFESDLKKLNAAIYSIIDLGLTAGANKSVDLAFQLRAKLESQQEVIGQLVAEVDTMRIRMQNRSGIVAGDLNHVLECLHHAKNKGISPTAKQYQLCVQLSDKMRRQLMIQEELRAALASKDFTSLKLSMDHAQEAEVEIELAQQVRALVRVLDAQRRLAQKAIRDGTAPASNKTPEPAAANAAAAAAPVSLNDKNAKVEYEQKLQKSNGVRYKWERFTDIRTDEDYSKGSSKKQRVIETKLQSQSTVIPKSLLVLDKTLNKVAIKVNKDILGYCGDRAMSFPPSLARDMLQKSAENPLLANETYVQLCKHITKNPKADSAGRAWQLMCMCVSSFPPSVDFELYLLNFLQSNVNVPGLVSNYARFALRRLEGMMTTGSSGIVPSIEEIAAYKERPPILATIQLVDGTPLTQGLPVTPDLDAEKVVDLCIHFLGLKDPRAKQLFAIFVVDDTERRREYQLEEKRWQAANETGKKPAPIENPADLPRTAKFLQKNEFLGSVIVQMTRLKHDFTFVFKRKLHLGDTLEVKSNGEEDAMYKKLIYLQAQDSFISGELGIHDLDQIVNVMSVAVAADNDPFPDSVERLLDDADVVSYVPRPYRRAKTDRDWAKAVLNSGAQFASDPSEYLQDKFVDVLKRQELYGAVFFHALRASESPDVVALPNHIILGVNALGVHLIDADNRRKGIVRTIRFDQIKRWGGSAKYFSFSVLKDAGPGTAAAVATGGDGAGGEKAAYELALNTPQASELSVQKGQEHFQ